MVEGESNIASREDVLAMLREHVYGNVLEGWDQVIWLHWSPPVVRFVAGTTGEMRAATIRVVDNVNAWLPWERHITVGADLNQVQSESLKNAIDYWEIFEHRDEIGPSTITAYIDSKITPENPRGGGFSGFHVSWNEGHREHIIQQELLHSLGMNGGRACFEAFGASCDNSSIEAPMVYYSHVPVSQFPESSMAYATPHNDEHGLSQIDGETIQILCTRLIDIGIREYISYPGTDFTNPVTIVGPAQLDMFDLGAWDDSVIRYAGSIDLPTTDFVYWLRHEIEAAFGVDWRNGLARPWADGWAAEGTFAESGLTGSATWTGELAGFTPAREAVHGDSAIVVNLRRMTGEAAFTALEHWAAGAAPGAHGTGTQWNDGDLHYSLALNGNHLRSDGGETVYVSGRFVGGEHQGVVGILERPDLTGAFGGTR